MSATAGTTLTESENAADQLPILQDAARRFLADWPPEKVEAGPWRETLAKLQDLAEMRGLSGAETVGMARVAGLDVLAEQRISASEDEDGGGGRDDERLRSRQVGLEASYAVMRHSLVTSTHLETNLESSPSR